MRDEAVELKRAGNRALAGRDYDQAKRAFASLIEAEPDAPDGYLGLAKVFERLNDYHSIVSLLRPLYGRVISARVARQLGDAYRVLANRGELRYVEPAIECYERYHSERKDPVTLFYLAEMYREHKKDYERALASYRESWDHDPRSRPAYSGVIACLKHLGRKDEVQSAQTLWQERNAGIS